METLIVQKHPIEFKKKQVLNIVDYLSEEAYLSDISLKDENYEQFFSFLYELVKNRNLEREYSRIMRSYICETIAKFSDLEEIGISELVQNLDYLQLKENSMSKIKNKKLSLTDNSF